MVNPPPPKKPANVITPFVTATYELPCGAPISIPLWYVEAPEVGAFLFPKYEFILKYPGAGQSMSPVSI